MEQFLQVGVISSTHGIRGEVKVFPTTDDPNRFKKLKKVILGRCMRFHRVFCPPADPSGVIPDSAHSRNCFDRNPWHCSAFRYDRNHFCNREVQSISGTAEAYHRRITRNFQSDRSRALSECNARTGYAGKFQTKTG